jgi:hypothetical protein
LQFLISWATAHRAVLLTFEACVEIQEGQQVGYRHLVSPFGFRFCTRRQPLLNGLFSQFIRVAVSGTTDHRQLPFANGQYRSCANFGGQQA